MDELKQKEMHMPPMGGPDGGFSNPPMDGPGGPPMREPVILPDLDWDNLTLDWAQYQNKWKKSEDGTYYALKFVYYATNVISKDHQYMNIYVPAEYLNADGTINAAGTCHGYTAKTAPIVMYNNCGGWMSSIPGNVRTSYIAEGFVHVDVGARSRDMGAEGKAPSACVDQKAAVRMLRLNDENIPGDKEKIVSCGGSGGGQMSSIIGATGNMPDYYHWLAEIGAAGIEKNNDGTYTSTIRDDIFASQCYCPIADINNADMAYAWQRFDAPELEYEGFNVPGRMKLTSFQRELQNDLAKAYGEYVNSLGLKNEQGVPLSLNPDLRSGTFYDQVLLNISDALNKWLAANVAEDGSLSFDLTRGFEKTPVSYSSVDAYIASLADTDQWLTNENGKYRITDLKGFHRGTGLARGKATPGFDTFHYTAENNAFGNAYEDGVHFSASNGRVMEANLEKYKALEGIEACDIDAYIADSKREDLRYQTWLMNATHILLDVASGRTHSDFSKHWRTRNGTADEHTSFAIAYNLCMAAKKAGADVDYALIWNAGHGDVDGDGTGTFEEWVHRICE